MKFIIAAAFAAISLTAQAQVQSDDVAFARQSDGRVLALSAQPCPVSGFFFWHIEDGKRTTHTGCWTFATHNRIMIMDRGEAVYFPIKRFSRNPSFGE
ncbi:gp30 [Burkholderia phage BcepB1A]|uniref:gp30 n=1 Tax=Burkholderia phage BcepB1A TaxID=279530 RepID=UPI000053EA5D|nr:gp30 [Burkholderia phage BcepB1A]AAY87910.1 gp30 [Burkholderia phage BcepB1A]